MHRFFAPIAVLTAAWLLSGCSQGSTMAPSPPVMPQSNVPAQNANASATSRAQTAAWPRPGPAERVCPAPALGYAACASWVRTDIHNSTTPSGYTPSDLQTAYGLTTVSASNGKGVTVAIVDAYVDSDAESNLATYRAQFGLPALASCSSTNSCSLSTCSSSTNSAPCFIVKAYGKRSNTGWGEEESLDVDMVSAICPHCNILLVEAASNSTSNLTTAEIFANSNAHYVSNSWSGNESTSTSGIDGDYQVSGVVTTAATGDSGYNATAQWPAILPGVVGAGGTSLTHTSPLTQSAWSGAGSGCSKIYAKPSYQNTINTGCSMRAQGDASADADPNTGVAVYDTFHTSGWLVFGGTSVATPIIASEFGLSGNTESLSTLYSYAYGTGYGNGSMYDVLTGSNGSCGAPLCTAGTDWDGPTGLGTPVGISAL